MHIAYIHPEAWKWSNGFLSGTSQEYFSVYVISLPVVARGMGETHLDLVNDVNVLLNRCISVLL